MTIYQRQFSAGEVVKAADISMSTLQNWIGRGVIIGHRKIEGGGSQGKHRRFSWYNVIEIATAAALVKVGVSDLKIAFQAAQHFAHTGPDEGAFTPKPDPAMPFDIDHGRTLMFVSGEYSEIIPYKPGSDDPLAIVRAALRQPEAFIVVDLRDLFDRVCAALGIHPQAVMDEAYSEAPKA